MKIMKALIPDASSGNLYTCDVIEHRGGLWFVPEWLEAPHEGYKIPARIIRFDNMKHQRANFAGHEFVLNTPIPKAVLDGQTKADYEVMDRPDIKFSIPKGIH